MCIGHQATQSVLVCLNTHRQEMVFAFFYPKSGKSNVNTVDKRLDDIACVLSLDHLHLKANFLPDSDKHLSLTHFPTAIQHVVSKIRMFCQTFVAVCFYLIEKHSVFIVFHRFFDATKTFNNLRGQSTMTTLAPA